MLDSGSYLLKVNLTLIGDKWKKTARRLNVFSFLLEPYWRRMDEPLFELLHSESIP